MNEDDNSDDIEHNNDNTEFAVCIKCGKSKKSSVFIHKASTFNKNKDKKYDYIHNSKICSSCRTNAYKKNK